MLLAGREASDQAKLSALPSTSALALPSSNTVLPSATERSLPGRATGAELVVETMTRSGALPMLPSLTTSSNS